eukprot:gnl/MRDRNA2_/MRDRNA2_114528_c0_seq1.p1 gnl/MRDRNA2_/MRDRNA2_114528_c0~~gnl/MRDRNA2_/MRDRNA2_114528_c0_seq1.p1  ORF type:complete len:463 (+),score=115.93 gnl/MRDRNA2_/MRDRNA2_114528_c0_seq1:142-1530(+)
MAIKINYCLTLTILILAATFAWLIVGFVQGTASVDFWNYDQRSWTTPFALMLFAFIVTASLAHRMRFILLELETALTTQKERGSSLNAKRQGELRDADAEKERLRGQIAANQKAMAVHAEAMTLVQERLRLAEEDLEGLNTFVASIDLHVEESLQQTRDHDRHLRELRDEHSRAEETFTTAVQKHRKIKTSIDELEEEDHQIKVWCAKQGSPEVAVQAAIVEKQTEITKLKQQLHACEGDLSSLELPGSGQDEATRPPMATGPGNLRGGAPSVLPPMPGDAQSPEGSSPERQHPPPSNQGHEVLPAVALDLEQTHRELREALQRREQELRDTNEAIQRTLEEHNAAAERLAEEASRVADFQTSAGRSSERLKAFESMQEMISESQGLLESCRGSIETERKEKVRLKAQIEQERLRAQLLLDILRHFKEKLQGRAFEAFQQASVDLEACSKIKAGNSSSQHLV